MKTTALENGVTNEDDDVFSSNRSYGSSFCGKPRPTMISAKYRLKEERRKVLKISINKLKKIEDPESSLRRSVLINNTMKRLQKEAREEKLMKQIQTFPRCYTPYKSSTSIFSKETICDDSVPDVLCDSIETKTDSLLLSDSTLMNSDSILANEVNSSSEKESSNFSMVCTETMDDFVDATGSCDKEIESITSVSSETSCSESAAEMNNHETNCASTTTARKRSFDEVEDCDVQDVLSQFYMPPTPRMLTSIDDTDDEDEDVNVVDIDIGTPEIPVVNTTSHSLEIPSNDSYSLNAKRPKLENESSDEQNVPCPSSNSVKECDASTEPSENHSRIFASASNDEDSDDIEVVLEDKEDIERRLMLCSGGTAISRTPVEEDPCWVNTRTNKPSCIVLTTPSDILVPDGNHTSHLRFGATSLIDKSTSNPYCAMNTNGSVPPVVLDHTDQHPYSCGHSSIFNELQSVVFHSLIASLES